MTGQRVAIIGAGAAGLACGYLLHRRFDLTVYECNAYPGGHANSVTVEHRGETVRFDTAFVVFNNVAYSLFVRMLDELQVASRYCPMSFSFQIMPAGLEYMTRGLTYCFCDLENLLSWRFLKMLFEMGRFHRQAREVLHGDRYRRYSIGDYVREKGYSEDFVHRFLIPLIAVTWSLPPEQMLGYPVLSLVEFLDHHGALQGVFGRKHWRTVVNGSRSYVDRITEGFKERVLCDRAVRRVVRHGRRVQVIDSLGEAAEYDHVIFACHADQALSLLADPTPLEQALLGSFKYYRSPVVVHTDPTLMPRKRRNWAGWNYRIRYDATGTPRSSITYHMNTLQKVSQLNDYFVTIGEGAGIDEGSILKRLEYEHPSFDLAAMEAQTQLHRLNRDGPCFFCGSYFKFGFHEDAFRSGVEVCRKLTGAAIWA